MFGWIAACGFALTAVLILVWDSKPWGDRIGAAVFAWLGVGAVYATALRPGVELCADTVTVRGYLTTLRFPRADLTHATAGSSLILHRASGSAVRVVAVANTNVTVVLGREGRAHRVAAHINDLLGEGAVDLGTAQPRREGFNWRAAAIVAAAGAIQVGLVLVRVRLS